MASVLKVQKANASKFEAKVKGKRKADDMDVDRDEPEPPVSKKKKNKQRVLLLSSRGITHRMRHFMNDLEALLPHVKKGAFRFAIFLLQVAAELPAYIRLEARLKITAPPPSRTG
jgi:hypothetical protein